MASHRPKTCVYCNRNFSPRHAMKCAACEDTRACEPCTVLNGGIPIVFECDPVRPGRFLRHRYCSGDCASPHLPEIVLCPVCKNPKHPFARSFASVVCESCDAYFVPATAGNVHPSIKTGCTQPRRATRSTRSDAAEATDDSSLLEASGLRRCENDSCNMVYSVLFPSCPQCTPDSRGEIRCRDAGCRIKYTASLKACPRCTAPKKRIKRIHSNCFICARKCGRGSIQCEKCVLECCKKCSETGTSGFFVRDYVYSTTKPFIKQAFCAEHSKGLEYLKCTTKDCNAAPISPLGVEVRCVGCFEPISQDISATRRFV